MTDPGPQIGLHPDRGRLHLNHGPIDLIIECDGNPDDRARALGAAAARFEGLLDQLVEELAMLRTPLDATALPAAKGPVAARMVNAARLHCAHETVTPMVAVAGSVADEIASAMMAAAPLPRWMVNNGGDIALGLTPGREYRLGVAPDPRRGTVDAAITITDELGIGGVATSGRHGRSFSLGIADAVTTFAANAATADAAATVIANRVDIGPHREITRERARDLDPDSDLGDRLVTVDVGILDPEESRDALTRGLRHAEALVADGAIHGAVLQLAGRVVTTSASGRWTPPVTSRAVRA